MKLRDLGEFELLRRVLPPRPPRDARVRCGRGDDCAVIAADAGWLQLVTTDMLVEDVHFIRQRVDPERLGAKAISVSLSDIAAMGGEPLHVYVSVALPADLALSDAEALFRGIDSQANRYGVDLLGGDTTASRGPIVIDVTCVGRVEPDRVLYRRGAEAGDALFVTGVLGDAAAGLHAILAGHEGSSPAADALVARHHGPEPHLAAARALARSGLVHAMIDLSDGLAGDLGHLCEASAVGATIELEALPLSAELQRYAAAQGIDPVHLALRGGEDYVLLLAAAPGLASAVGAEVPLFAIGTVDAPAGLRARRAGSEAPLLAHSWVHFTTD